MEYLNWYIKKLLVSTILNDDNQKIYQEGLKTFTSETRRKVEAKLAEIEMKKSSIKEKSLEYAELLPYTSENQYVNIMKQISNLSAQRATLEMEEVELSNRYNSLPKITIKEIKTFMSKYRNLMNTKDKELLRKTIFHLVEKIVIDNETVEVRIDLMKYFNIPQVNDEEGIILRIRENRNLIANKPKHNEIDFTSQKLIESFELLKESQ